MVSENRQTIKYPNLPFCCSKNTEIKESEQN